jgi:hypothetical protein
MRAGQSAVAREAHSPACNARFCDPKSAGLFRPTRPTLGNFSDNKKAIQIGTGVFSVSALEAYTYPRRSGFSTVIAMIAARKSIVIIKAIINRGFAAESRPQKPHRFSTVC